MKLSSSLKILGIIIIISTQAIITESFSFDNRNFFIKKIFFSGYKYTQSGNSEKAIEQFRKLQGEGGPLGDYVLFFLGRELHKLGRCSEARESFQSIVDRFPESRWFSLAQAQVNAAPETCPPLEIPKTSQEKEDCTLKKTTELQAECFFSYRNYQPAKLLYQKLTEKKSRQKKKGVELLIRLSQSAARSQDFDQAILANQIIRERYPKTPEAFEALKKIAFLYQDRLNYPKAIETFESLIPLEKNAQEKRTDWEKVGWAYWRLGRYDQALKSFNSGLAVSETPFLLYWKARCLEKSDKKSAKEVFQNIVSNYPQTYYALRSLDHLEMGQKEAHALLSSWWIPLQHSMKNNWEVEGEVFDSNDPGLVKVALLQEMGLVEDALLEAHRWRWQKKIIEPLFFRSSKEGLLKEGDSFVVKNRKLIQESSEYPMPYADFVWSRVKFPQKTNIDPYLVYSMMRQESRYRPNIVSPVGAIGMLQIMPYTGRRLALRDAGWGIYQDKWLYDPVINIDLSIHYLDQLDHMFNGRWYLMVASYNAGEHVVKEWAKLRENHSEEEFIEEIPYGETKNYVKKIYANWQAYKSIYLAKH